VHLLAPIGDRERMLLLAEKAVEIGVSSWRPVLWRRSRSVSPRGEGPGFSAKLRARMIAALIQSRGAWLPDLFPDALPERAAAAAPDGSRFLLDAEGESLTAMTLSEPVSLAVGPEGGFEAAERALFVEAGFQLASLGAGVLRFETAGILAAGIASATLTARTSVNG
jgi:16S rRNA (uracil1498-N3)-methyltransferase